MIKESAVSSIVEQKTNANGKVGYKNWADLSESAYFLGKTGFESVSFFRF